MDNIWKKCSSCKKPIPFNTRYYVCSVSTCNGQRTGYVFCQHSCFETHLPGARHRDAAAIEETSPKNNLSITHAEQARFSKNTGPVRRVIAASTGPSSAAITRPAASASLSQGEVLVIASRLKEFINQRSGGFNTSASVIDVLSYHLRVICDKAIDKARLEGRKTVMDRDFDFLRSFKI